MAQAAREAGVYIAAGDTKVVQRGSADKLFINTSGVGSIAAGHAVSGSGAKPGDVVLLSGPIGDHGIAVLSAREDLGFETDLASDVAPLNHLVRAMREAGAVNAMRDPTRGGLATALKEIASQSSVSIELDEEAIPVRPAVRAACELMGFDPLHVANEGKLVACVPAHAYERTLQAMRATRYGEEACRIGEVSASSPGQVTLRTGIGGTRVLDMLAGEMLPRIC